jgi:hypothetical protein
MPRKKENKIDDEPVTDEEIKRVAIYLAALILLLIFLAILGFSAFVAAVWLGVL